MESEIIWGLTAIVLIVIFLPYFFKFRRKQKEDIQRRREAQQLGIGRPMAQFPMIDASLCIGCGSCVEACPEGDVLGIVFGKAVVINGQRCVGHGYCEQVCPVSSLKVGLGDITTRPDIPILDEHHQTSVPGLFIAGELGGISLIRNAVTQGRTAVNRIALLKAESSVKAQYDVVIVGCGPAGMSSALTAVEHSLSYVVIDQQGPGGTILQYPRKKLVMTQPVEIPLYGRLGKSEYSKEHLLEIWETVAGKFHVNTHAGEKMEKVVRTGDRFEVSTTSGTYTSRFVVLAMGRRGTPRKLGVPGEEQAKVMYQLVDAQSYNGQNLLVVGGGDSAVEAAVGLARQDNNNVYISYRKPKFFRIKKKNEDRIGELIDKKKIKPLFNSQVLGISPESVKLKTDEGEIEIQNDFVFVFAGGIPPFDMLKEMGIAFGGEYKKIA